jgi:hypothetical protein
MPRAHSGPNLSPLRGGECRPKLRLPVMIGTMKSWRCSKGRRTNLSIPDNNTPTFYDRSHASPLGHSLGHRLGRNQHHVTPTAWREAIVRQTKGRGSPRRDDIKCDPQIVVAPQVFRSPMNIACSTCRHCRRDPRCRGCRPTGGGWRVFDRGLDLPSPPRTRRHAHSNHGRWVIPGTRLRVRRILLVSIAYRGGPFQLQGGEGRSWGGTFSLPFLGFLGSRPLRF